MSLKKIAEVAGVSVSTVSLALAGKGRISEGVRERVLRVARELDYKRPLYSKQSRVVAVLYSIDKEWGHVLEFMNGILGELESALSEAGYTAVIVPLYFAGDKEDVVRKLDDIAPVAVCSIHYVEEGLFAGLEKRGIPVVIINRSLFQDKFCTVCVDDFQGAYEGGRYLLEQAGGSGVVFFGYARSNMTNLIDDRAYGFQKALLEAGLSAGEEAMHYIDEPLEEGVAAKLKELESSGWPRAIYAYDDYLAAYVVAGLARISRTLAARVEILAPGDTLNYALPFTPRLNTMSIDTGLLGRLGAQMLLSRLEVEGFRLLVQKVRQRLVRRR